MDTPWFDPGGGVRCTVRQDGVYCDNDAGGSFRIAWDKPLTLNTY